MRLLDLSHNMLEKLDNKTHSLIEDCLSLEKVSWGSRRVASPDVAFWSAVQITVWKWELNSRLMFMFQLVLNHNQMSSIGDKTFPESPWIPYRLSDVDLSYNRIPVITSKLLIGTKKLKRLNLRGNNILEIREGMHHLILLLVETGRGFWKTVTNCNKLQVKANRSWLNGSFQP